MHHLQQQHCLVPVTPSAPSFNTLIMLFLLLINTVFLVEQWCDDNPDEPLSMELLGLLPAALESPTRLAVALFVTTRWAAAAAACMLREQFLSCSSLPAHNTLSLLLLVFTAAAAAGVVHACRVLRNIAAGESHRQQPQQFNAPAVISHKLPYCSTLHGLTDLCHGWCPQAVTQPACLQHRSQLAVGSTLLLRALDNTTPPPTTSPPLLPAGWSLSLKASMTSSTPSHRSGMTGPMPSPTL
jgi:hypothetical protein